MTTTVCDVRRWFAQLEYNKDKVSAFVSGGLTNTSYWRKDRFYYSGDKQLSSKKHYLGGNVKAGLNYNLDDYNNVFFNTGFISRAPILIIPSSILRVHMNVILMLRMRKFTLSN